MRDKPLVLDFLLIAFILLISLSAFLTRMANNHQDSRTVVEVLPQSSKTVNQIPSSPLYLRDRDGGFDPSTASCVTIYSGSDNLFPIQRLLETCDNSIDPITKSPKNIIYEYALESDFRVASADSAKEMTAYPISCDQYCQEFGFPNGVCSPAKITCGDENKPVTAGYCNCVP